MCQAVVWPRPRLAEARPARPRSQLGCRPAGRARSLHPQQVAALEVPRRTASETAQQPPQQGFTALPSTRSTTDQSYWTRRLLCYDMPLLDLTNVCSVWRSGCTALQLRGPGRAGSAAIAAPNRRSGGRAATCSLFRAAAGSNSPAVANRVQTALQTGRQPTLHHHTRAWCPLAW